MPSGPGSAVWNTRRSSHPHHGPVRGNSGGLHDRFPMRVRPGSYVLPADTASALGDSNGEAGQRVLSQMFGSGGPYGARLPRRRAAGGAVEEHVPIITSAGEHVIPPEVVREIGGGDLDVGSAVLDRFVMAVRANYARMLEELPPPKDD